jgi:hypothetical protein
MSYIEHFCSEVKRNEIAAFCDVRCNEKKESVLCLWVKTFLLTPT